MEDSKTARFEKAKTLTSGGLALRAWYSGVWSNSWRLRDVQGVSGCDHVSIILRALNGVWTSRRADGLVCREREVALLETRGRP